MQAAIATATATANCKLSTENGRRIPEKKQSRIQNLIDDICHQNPVPSMAVDPNPDLWDFYFADDHTLPHLSSHPHTDLVHMAAHLVDDHLPAVASILLEENTSYPWQDGEVLGEEEEDMEADMLRVEVESYLLQEARVHVRDIRPSMEVARLGVEVHDR
jgi:hypothetical protein